MKFRKQYDYPSFELNEIVEDLEMICTYRTGTEIEVLCRELSRLASIVGIMASFLTKEQQMILGEHLCYHPVDDDDNDDL